MSTRIVCIAFGMVAVLGMASLAQAVAYTNPTLVNLLERWNPNGTYAFATSTDLPNASNVFQMIDFPLGGTGYRGNVGNPVGTGTSSTFARITFDSPKVIDELLVQFRDDGHSPDNYTFADQNGVFVTNSTPGTPIGGSTIIHNSFGTRTSDFIEIRSNPRNTNTAVYEIIDLGVYLAPTETLHMDGTYNVFYEENPTPTGFNSSLWTNLIADRLNPGNANSTTWAFNGRYKFTGAYMSHEIFSKNMEGAKIEISEDGSTWNTAFGAADFGQGYMVFSQAYWGKYARLSWADSGSGGGEEIHEFQLFVYVPEPSSALALFGAMALLARRRRRGAQALTVAA